MLAATTSLTALTAALALLANNPTALASDNPLDYCVRYYGAVTAELDMPDTLPKYNDEGDTLCPQTYNFLRTQGGVLRLCPPLATTVDTDGQLLDVELVYGHTMGELSFPIDNLKLSNLLVTNGSMPGPFDENADPAILAADPKTRGSSDWSFMPTWTINGTERSLIEDPVPKTNEGVYFSCLNIVNSPRYCEAHSGCWHTQTFEFSMQSHLNYSIKFSNTDASVEIFAEGEWNSTGGNTIAKISFDGARAVPSVTNYGFWEHYDQMSYEVAKAYESDEHVIRIKADGGDGPLFYNDTESGESFAAMNGTFSTSAAAWGFGGEPSLWIVFMIGMVAVWMEM